MPKYNPTDEDMYETKPCFICGREVIDPKEETCCEFCEEQKKIFEDDYEWLVWKDIPYAVEY
jgi:hypothetical protein